MSGNDPDDRNPDCPEGCGEMDEVKNGYGSWICQCSNEECIYHNISEVEKLNEKSRQEEADE